MNPDQVCGFATRGSNSRFVDSQPTWSITTTTSAGVGESARQANNAGSVTTSVPSFQQATRSLTTSVPTIHHAPQGGSSTTDAHFFFSSANPPSAAGPLRPANNAGSEPCPANNAGREVLAQRSVHAPVNWQPLMHPLDLAVTEPQNASRSAGGTMDTCEARTFEIMQYIWRLLDNYDRLQAVASSLQPYPEDHYNRLSQLYTSVRAIIDELRNDCTQYTLAMGDWDALNTAHLSTDNEWSRRMLQRRRTFFEDPAFIPKQLDEKQMDLLEYYERLRQRIEDITKELIVRPTMPAVLECCRPPSSNVPPFASARSNLLFNSTDLKWRTVPAGPTGFPRVDTQSMNCTPMETVDTEAIVAVDGGVLEERMPPPIRMGWTTARGGSRTSQDRLKATMFSYASAAGAGRGPIKASSGPLQIGADGKPFGSGSSAPAAHPSPASGDADFGAENTSAFYRNASYQRTANANTASPWPTLKELPVTLFDGDERAYPAFRNNFLQLVESQPRLEPHHKMQYLLQHLRGEPHRLVSGYTITDANYFHVADLLEERYGDQQRVGLKLLQQLVAMPPPSEEARDLRRFRDDCSRLLSELRHHGENPDATAMLSQTLLSKLPVPVPQEIIRRADQLSGHLATQTILVKLYENLRVLENANVMSLEWSSRDPSGQQCRGDSRGFRQNQPSSHQPPPSRYSNFITDTQIVTAKCAFCEGPHWSSQCHVYDTIPKRLRRVKELALCFLCFRGGHWTASCPKRKNEPCRFCSKGQHHQSLCGAAHCRFKDLLPGPMSDTKTELATPTVPLGGPSAASPTALKIGAISPPRPGPQDLSVSWSTPTTDAVATASQRLPSAQISPALGADNSSISMTKPSQENRTNPDGLRGTRSPTADIINESMSSKDAHASGAAEYLLRQKYLRTTDRCSHPDERAQFDQPHVDGSDRALGAEDGHAGHELRHEDFSPTKPSGITDDYPDWSVAETTPRFDNVYTGETEATTPLLECLLATAKNPWTDDLCTAVIVFDRYRTTSVITKELVRKLGLPAASTPTYDFESFTGYITGVDLFSAGGFKLSLYNLATGRLPQAVRTVFVDEKHLAALRRAKLLPEVFHVQPHILLAADVMTRINYRHGPRLSEGPFSVHTLLGLALGGCLKSDLDTYSKAPTRSWFQQLS